MYDVAVVGGGPGGYVAAIKAAQLGMKVGSIYDARSQNLFRSSLLLSTAFSAAFCRLCEKPQINRGA
jgi:thioredoxin reductase